MIYITGDIHGDPEGLFVKPFTKNLGAGDYVIICGDFGMVWGGKIAAVHKYWLDHVAAKPYKLLFIDGNHENFDMLSAFPTVEFAGGRVQKLRPNIFHLLRGEIYTLAGQTFFCFGGAHSIDKSDRASYLSWWPEEIPSAAEFKHAQDNLARVHHRVDYMLTHTVPEMLFQSAARQQRWGDDYCPVRRMLDQLAEGLTYKAWFAGHMHVDMVNSDKHFYWLYHDVLQLAPGGKITKLFSRKK